MAEPGTVATRVQLKDVLVKPPYNVKHTKFIDFLTKTSDYQGSEAGRYTRKGIPDYEATHAVDLFFRGNCEPRSVTTRLPVVIKGVDGNKLRGGPKAKEQGWFARKHAKPHLKDRMAVASVTPDAARISLCDQLKREYRRGGWAPIDYKKLYEDWKLANPHELEDVKKIEKQLKDARTQNGPGRSRTPRVGHNPGPRPRQSPASSKDVFDSLFNAASNVLRRRVYDHAKLLHDPKNENLKNWEWVRIQNKLRNLKLRNPDLEIPVRYKAQAVKNNATVAARASHYHAARKGDVDRVMSKTNWSALPDVPGRSFPPADAQKLSVITRYLGGNAASQSQAWHYNHALLQQNKRLREPEPANAVSVAYKRALNAASVAYKKEAYEAIKKELERREAQRAAAERAIREQQRKNRLRYDGSNDDMPTFS